MPARLVAALLICACIALQGCQRSTGHPAASPDADSGSGKAVYLRECAVCHGTQGAGTQIAPSLKGLGQRKSFAAVLRVVADPQPPMPKLYPSRLTRRQLRDVSAYVRSL